MFQQTLPLSDHLRENSHNQMRFQDDECKIKKRKKSGKKKKNVIKIRMEQVSTAYNSDRSKQSKQIVKGYCKQFVRANISPRASSSQHKIRKNINNLTLLSQRHMLNNSNEQNYELQNLYNTSPLLNTDDIFYSSESRSKSTRNFIVPLCMKTQVELNKLKAQQERLNETENKEYISYNVLKIPEQQGQIDFFPKLGSLSTKKSNSVVISNPHQEQSVKTKFSQQFQYIKEINSSLDANKYNVINQQDKDQIGSKSSTQPVQYTNYVKQRSLTLNQNDEKKLKTQIESYTNTNLNADAQHNLNENSKQLIQIISNQNINNQEQQNPEQLKDNKDKDLNASDLYKPSYHADTSLSQNVSKRDFRSFSQTCRAHQENYSFQTYDNIERLKKKLSITPREYIPLGTKYSFKSDVGYSNYFKGVSQTPKIENYKQRQFNEGSRDTSPSLSMKISNRFFDKSQQNQFSGVAKVINASSQQLQEFDIKKVKQKTAEIKKSTEKLAYYPWRLNIIMSEKEAQEKRNYSFQFESNNSSHKQPPQKKQQLIEARYQNLIQKKDFKRQLEELNKMITKQKIQRTFNNKENNDQAQKSVRFQNNSQIDIQQ